jgi:hypothetical protein
MAGIDRVKTGVKLGMLRSKVDKRGQIAKDLSIYCYESVVLLFYFQLEPIQPEFATKQQAAIE